MTETRPPPPERFIPGQILADRYRVVELVGRGGMGEVYRARDLKLGETVALKFRPPDLGRDPERLQSLIAEVRLSRQISHPNVCRVHDIEEMDGTHFLSMEFVDGENLASLLRRIGRLPPAKAVEIAREMCAGLSAIHDRGVLHRDLKPANVMIDGRGHARITDFGLAELQGVGTDPEMIIGTPAYMAPECLLGGPPTVQSDLYSLGLVLYELFTGEHPSAGQTLHEIVHLRRDSSPESFARLVRDVDPRVERATLLCLESDPARRPLSAEALAATLPGGDALAAAIAAGRTPSPELVAAARSGQEGLSPAMAWACLAGLIAGVALVTAIAPRTRLIPALAIPEPAVAMAARAHTVLREAGIPAASGDRAFGYQEDETAVERIAAHDRSRSRWDSLRFAHPPIVTFWYRESPADLLPAAPAYQVEYDDPPLANGAGVRLDVNGRLLRLDAPPSSSWPPVVAALNPGALFRAAGLDTADFRPTRSEAAPAAAGDQRMTYLGTDRATDGRPLRVELVAFHGRPVSFVVEEVTRSIAADPSAHTISVVRQFIRPTLFLGALFIGVWLARRNLRAGRGDAKRALRVAGVMMGLRVAAWAIGSHYTPGSLTAQLMSAIAWGLYDLAYCWASYVAVEPYMRRLWPHVLTTWVRLLDGQHADARVGRDVLVGCLGGVLIALAVAGHQAAPALFGAPPGRPDNVGFVEDQLVALLGLRHQVAGLFGLWRSNIITTFGFVVILVMARLLLRHAGLAVLAAGLIFVPLALPRGEFVALNVALAMISTGLLLFLMVRFGLLAATVALLVHTVLEAAPLGMGVGSWPTSRTVIALALVMGVGLYAFARAQGERGALRELL